MGMRDVIPPSGTQRKARTRGQVSFEYLLVVGFTFAILVPLLLLYTNTQRETQAALAEGQVTRFANTIRDAAERVYYAGEPAQETLTLTLPEGVLAARTENTTIVYTVRGASGAYDIAVDGLAPINDTYGGLPTAQGKHTIVVLAANRTVYVIPR